MPLGPHVLDVQEDLYRALLLTGLDERTVAQVAGLVEAHVFGAARSAITDTSVVGADRRHGRRLLGVARRVLGHVLLAGAVPDDDPPLGGGRLRR